MVVVDGQGVPIGADLDSASPSEIKLLQPTIEKIAVPRKGGGRPRQNPVRIIADKGYNSDPLRERLSNVPLDNNNHDLPGSRDGLGVS